MISGYRIPGSALIIKIFVVSAGQDPRADIDSKDSEEVINQAHERRIKHWQFFTGAEMMKVPKVEGAFKGLHLPRIVVDKIYQKNAEKWFPGLKNRRS